MCPSTACHPLPSVLRPLPVAFLVPAKIEPSVFAERLNCLLVTAVGGFDLGGEGAAVDVVARVRDLEGRFRQSRNSLAWEGQENVG
jgi:hypothetical protein